MQFYSNRTYYVLSNREINYIAVIVKYN